MVGGKNIIMYFLFLLLSISFSYAVDISSCQELNESGQTYTLNVSVTSDGTCFTIDNTSITLDCQGNSINFANTTGGAGIIVQGNSATIIDCLMNQTNFAGDAIRLYANYTTILNSEIYTVNESSRGIENNLGSNWNIIRNNQVYTQGAFVEGITVAGDNNFIADNIIIVSGSGAPAMALYSTTKNNTFQNNRLETADDMAIDDQTTLEYYSLLKYNNTNGSITWNITDFDVTGNLKIGETIFMQYNNIGIADSANLASLNTSADIEMYSLPYLSQQPYLLKDGIRCDNSSSCNITSYTADGTIIARVAGFSNYTTQHTPSACGDITGSIKLNQDVGDNQTCFNVKASNLFIDCAGYQINYSMGPTLNYAYGINVSGYNNVTVKNCVLFDGYNFESYVAGILFSNSDGSTAYNNTIYGNTSGGDDNGIKVFFSDNTQVLQNTIYLYENSMLGINVDGSNNVSVMANTISTNATVDDAGIIPIKISKSTGTKSSNVSILGNTIYTNNNVSNGIEVRGNNITVRGNTVNIFGYNSDGIVETALDVDTALLIELNNIFTYNNASNGIYSANTNRDYVQIKNNTIITNNATSVGVYASSPATNTTGNNITTAGFNSHGIQYNNNAGGNHYIADNIITTQEMGGIGLRLSNFGSGNNITNNLVNSYATGLFLDGNSGSNEDNVFELNNITSTSGYAIYTMNGARYNTFKNNYLKGSSNSIGVFYGGANANHTNILTYENAYGSIWWNATDLSNNLTLDIGYGVYMQDNLVGLADLGIGNLANLFAMISIKGLPYNETPKLYKDGVRCDDTSNCNITWDNSTKVLSANVSGFSNYTTQSSTATSVSVTDCGDLEQNNTYYNIDNDITQNNSQCFWVPGNNVTIDCQGNTITSNGTGVAFMITRPSGTAINVTIKNCIINNFSRAVQSEGLTLLTLDNLTIPYYTALDAGHEEAIILNGVNASYITNVTIDLDNESTKNGILLINSYQNIIDSNTFTNLNSTDYTKAALFLGYTGQVANGNNVSNNQFISTNVGIRINEGMGNKIYSNNFSNTNGREIIIYNVSSQYNQFWLNYFTSNNSVQDNGANNLWNNTATGNYWLEYNGVNDYDEGDTCTDNDEDGFCDISYSLAGSAGSNDNKAIFQGIYPPLFNVTKTILNDPVALSQDAVFMINITSVDPDNWTGLTLIDMYNVSEFNYSGYVSMGASTISSPLVNYTEGNIEWEFNLTTGSSIILLVNFTTLLEGNLTNGMIVKNTSDEVMFFGKSDVAEVFEDVNFTVEITSLNTPYETQISQFLINVTNLGLSPAIDYTVHLDYPTSLLSYDTASVTESLDNTTTGVVEWVINISASSNQLIYANFTSIVDGTDNINVSVEDLGVPLATDSSSFSILNIVPPSLGTLRYDNDTTADLSPNINFHYGENVTQLSARCTYAYNQSFIRNVSFVLYNVEDNNIVVDMNATSVAGTKYIAGITGFIMNDSGMWWLNVTCILMNGSTLSTNVGKDLPFGTVTVNVTSPANGASIQHGTTFDFNSTISCIGGECQELNISLLNIAQFTTSDDNPMDSSNTPALASIGDGSLYVVSWTLNATGNYGSYELIANLTDYELNVVTDAVNVSVVDNTLPTVDLVSPVLIVDYSNTILNAFIFNISDSYDANLTCSLYINGVVNATKVINIANNVNITTNLAEGNGYTWYINCTDAYGNYNVTTDKYFTVDLTAPVSNATIVSGNEGGAGYYRTAVTVNISKVLEDNSNLIYYNVTNSTGYYAGNNSAPEFSVVISDDENYTIYYWAIDDAGNIEIKKNISFVIDTINPVFAEFNITVTNGTTINSSDNVTLNFIITDANPDRYRIYVNGTDVTGMVYGIADGTPIQYNWTNASQFIENNVTFRIYTQDKSNWEAWSTTYYVYVLDNTPPTVNIISQDYEVELYTSNQTFNLTYYANDSLSIANCTLSIYNSTGDVVDTNINASGTLGLYNYYPTISYDGRYRWNVTCYDNSGNVGTSETGNITLDTTYPTYLLSGVQSSWQNSPFNITINVTDAIRTDLNIVLDQGTYSLGSTKNYKILITADGNQSAQINITDEAGNLNSTTVSGILLDTGNPVFGALGVSDGASYNTNKLITFSASDNLSGLNYTFINITGPQNYTNQSSSVMTFNATSTGNYTLTYMAVDMAGNSLSNTIWFTIDVAAPALIFTNPNSGWTNTVFDIAVNASDVGLSGLAGVNVTLSLQSNISSASEDFTFEINASGNQTVTIIAYDYNGNSNITQFNVYLDKIAPTMNISTEQDQIISVNYTTLSWTAVDVGSHSPIDTVWYAVNAQNVTLSNLTGTQNTIELADGNYQLVAYINDTAGNIANDTLNFTIDTTNPSIAFDVTPSNTENNWAFVNVSVSDTNFANITFSLYKSGTLNTTQTYSSASNNSYNFTTLSEGNYTVKVDVTDLAGNTNTTGLSSWFIVDSVSPVVGFTFATYNHNHSTNKNYKFYNVSITELFFSNITFELRNSTGDVINQTTYSDSTRSINFTLPKEDIYTVNVSVSDLSGNVGKAGLFFIYDNTSPVLTINLPQNNTNTSNNLFNLTITDNYRFNGVKIYNITSSYLNSDCTGNETSVICVFNETGLTSSSYNLVTIIANDDATNSIKKVLYFGYDDDAPIITLISNPANSSVNAATQPFNLTVNITDAYVGVDKQWYSVDGLSNTTFTGTEFTINNNLTAGQHKIIIYANDTLNNVNTLSNISIYVLGDVNFTQVNSNLGSKVSSYVKNISFIMNNQPLNNNQTVNVSILQNLILNLRVNITNLGNNMPDINVTIPKGINVNWAKNFNVTITDSAVNLTARNKASLNTIEMIIFEHFNDFIADSGSYNATILLDYNIDNLGLKILYFLTDLGDSFEILTNDSSNSAYYTVLANNKTKVFLPHFSGIVVANDTYVPSPALSKTSYDNSYFDLVGYILESNLDMASYNITNSTGDLVASYSGSIQTSKVGANNYTFSISLENITDGNYNITIVANDTNGAENISVISFTVTDSTAPNITSTASSAQSSTTDTVSKTVIITSDESVDIVYKFNSGSWTSLANNTKSTSKSFTLSIGTNNLTINATDIAGNPVSITRQYNYTKTTTTTPTTNTGGGGGGGGGGGALTLKRFILERINASSPVTLKVLDDLIDNIEITVSEDVTDVKVTYEKHTSKPASVDEPKTGEHVFDYFEITPTFTNTKEATIQFKVSKTELNTNKISNTDVRLYRFTDKWEELDTSILKENSTTVFYEAQTPGFSVFKVSQKIEEEVSSSTNDTDEGPIDDSTSSSETTDSNSNVNDGDNEQGGDDTISSDNKSSIFLKIISSVIIIGIIVIILLYLKGKIGKKPSSLHKTINSMLKKDSNISKIKDYISKKRKLGVSDQHIKHELLNVGWSESQVKNAFDMKH